MVDCNAIGTAGHAAREDGDNALYKALEDINWIRAYKFDKVSELLGAVSMKVTVIETLNKTHNIIPAECKFVLDVRINELYQLEEIADIINRNLQSHVKPRSLRLRSTFIDPNHPLVLAGKALGKNYFGSPTSSDKSLMPFPALKIGPGDSARSHTADEFVYKEEIKNGIADYIELLNQLL